MGVQDGTVGNVIAQESLSGTPRACGRGTFVRQRHRCIEFGSVRRERIGTPFMANKSLLSPLQIFSFYKDSTYSSTCAESIRGRRGFWSIGDTSVHAEMTLHSGAKSSRLPCRSLERTLRLAPQLCLLRSCLAHLHRRNCRAGQWTNFHPQFAFGFICTDSACCCRTHQGANSISCCARN